MTWLVLIATITTAELQAAMLAAMASVGLPTTSWTKQGFWQNLVNWFAFLLRGAYLILGDTARNAFLPTASGPGLTDLANGTFGTARRIETFATGTVTFLNNSGAPLDEAIEAISIESDADPTITYKNSAAAYALNGDSVTVAFVCDVAGTVGNTLANAVSLVTTLTGVTITSSTAFAGQDEQADADLRVLATKQAANLSDGHVNKFEWIVLNTNTDGTIAELDDGKTRLNINRVSVTNDSADGTVTVVLASPSGAVDAGEYATAISMLTQYVLANPGILDDYNADPVTLNIEISVALRRGASTAGVSAEITAYLTAWFVSSDNGIASDNGFLRLKELEGVVYRSRSNIKSVTIETINAAPAANVALAFDEVAILGTLVVVVSVET